MIKEMSPIEVRKILGISRSAIRYYTEKGLISAKKNEQNGYSYFSGADLLELIDVAFFRNCLNADVNEIHSLTYAENAEEYLEVYTKQNDLFEKEIRRREESLVLLRDFEKQIRRALKSLNTFSQQKLTEAVYLFYPEDGLHMDVHSMLFSVSYWLGKYRMKGNTVVHEASPMMVNSSFVDFLDKEFPTIRYEKLEKQPYLYSAFISDKEINDPSILDDILVQGKEQGPISWETAYIRYLCTFRNEGKRCCLYEVFLPFGEMAE